MVMVVVVVVVVRSDKLQLLHQIIPCVFGILKVTICYFSDTNHTAQLAVRSTGTRRNIQHTLHTGSNF